MRARLGRGERLDLVEGEEEAVAGVVRLAGVALEDDREVEPAPSSYDLGESLRAAKIDLAEAVGFDRAAAREAVDRVRPGLEILETSARTGEGMDEWLARLTGLVARGEGGEARAAARRASA